MSAAVIKTKVIKNRLDSLKAEYQQHQARMNEIKSEVKQWFEILNAVYPVEAKRLKPERWQ